MKHDDLIDRYIYAVTKALPGKTRKDVSNELNSLIADMLSERCSGRIAGDEDIKAVLGELGDPYELAQKYDPNDGKFLIGPPYYSKYTFVMKLVLICLAAGVTIGIAVWGILEELEWYNVLASWFSTILTATLAAFGAVTLLFAVLYKKGVSLDCVGADFDLLPSVPKGGEVISTWEPVAGIIISAIFCAVFLCFPEILGGHFGSTFIPLFDADGIREIWYIPAAFGLIGITRSSIELFELRYSKKLMIATVSADCLSIALSFAFLLNPVVLNPEFSRRMSSLLAGSSELVLGFAENMHLLFLVIIVFCLLLDMACNIIRTLRLN